MSIFSDTSIHVFKPRHLYIYVQRIGITLKYPTKIHPHISRKIFVSIESEIFKHLKKHPEGVMILDLAEAIGVHRHTVTKYVYRLEGAGKIKVRKVGIAKLCYLVEEKK